MLNTRGDLKNRAVSGLTNRRAGTLLLAIWMLAIAGTAPTAMAAVARLSTGNDLLGGNPIQDDEYSAALDIEFVAGDRSVVFREYLFTDRFRSGRRFDETTALVDVLPNRSPRWLSTFQVGATRVGRGLFGQPAQNEVHRLGGDEILDLDYVEASLHPTVVVEFIPVPSHARWVLQPAIDMELSRGFRSTVGASFGGRWKLARRHRWHAEAGVRHARSETAILDPFLEDLAPTGSVGVALFSRWEIRWTYNRFGNAQRHLSFAVLLPLDKIGRAGRR